MARVADSFLFRARAARLDWSRVAARQTAPLREQHLPTPKWYPDPKRLRERSQDIHLTWACARRLGVPRGPFTVWTRRRAEPKLREVEVETFFLPEGRWLWWGGIEAALVEVTCQPIDSSRPVGLFLYRTSPSLYDVVAAKAITPGGPGSVTLRVPTSGATQAVLVNGSAPGVLIEALADVVDSPEWSPVELVGLPVDQPWDGTDYDARDQGPVSAPMPPVDAAVSRLVRGGPPLGWAPSTETGRVAPDWVAPDPGLLVDEIRKDLISRIGELYDSGLREYRQAAVSGRHVVAGPQQDGRTSSLETKVDLRPWSFLMLPALTDPFLNLATGFGSAYSVEPLGEGRIAVGGSDFLVTAPYESLPFPHAGPAEVAAYAPAPELHAQVPDATGLACSRDGLVPPAVADLPWRETVRLSWDRLPVTAGLGSLTQSAAARFDPATAAPAESLLPKRDSGGWRPLVISPDGPPGEPGHDRVSVVESGAEIPLGSNGRHLGYAVAVGDVFGLWSSWQDTVYDGDEPGPEPPRVISLELKSTYAGASSCPAVLRVELGVEWVQRTPASVDVVAIFFPMTTPTTAPPAGLSPEAPTPPACFRRDLSLTFSGDTPIAVGCEAVSLDPTGAFEAAPGPGQGDGGRRYALVAAVPMLDFSSTPRWGVQVWAQRELHVGASPSAWAPDAGHPAVATAASPVPVQPLPPPAPPGVPLGSTIDAQGRSHVRVHWSLPAGSDARTIVIWEVAETSLRQRCGLPPRAPDTDPPGVRLAALWAAYDGLTADERRNAFRRLQEVDGSLRELDVPLPKGSTDIHLFTVTAITATGVESPWPSGPGAPHEHLQAVISPRLREPAPPLVRSTVGEAGAVAIELQAASPIQVTTFRLFRTRSEGAARSVETMGPAFADAPAGGPVGVDTLTSDPVYGATWTGTLPEAWDLWLIRAVAVPVDTVPVQGVRGLPSAASDVVSLVVPPEGPPDLAALEYDLWGGDHRGVVVRSSTSAPARAVPAGSHRLSAGAGSLTVTAVALEELPQTALTAPPPAASASAVPERGARAGGRSPLALWFTRPVAADPVDVTLRLIDPLGRATERSVTVPGWTPPPPVDLSLVDTFAIAGRGVLVEVDCDAPVDADPPYVMEVRAVQRPRRLGSPLPALPLPLGRGAFGPLEGQTLEAAEPLNEIPREGTPVLPGRRIQIQRESADEGHRYAVWVPLTSPVSVVVAVVAPDGGRVSVSASV